MSGFRVAKGAAPYASSWTVYDAAGNRVAGLFTHRSQAEDRREALARAARARRRACLCCGDVFLSEGAHNRMCKGCRGRGDAGAFDLAAPAIERRLRS